MGNRGTAFSLTQFSEVLNVFIPALATVCHGHDPKRLITTLRDRRGALAIELAKALEGGPGSTQEPWPSTSGSVA